MYNLRMLKKAALCCMAVCIVSGAAGCGFSNVDSKAQSGNQNITGPEGKEAANQEMSGQETTTQAAATQSATSAATVATQAVKAENRTMGVCGIYIYNEAKSRREFVEKTYESAWVKGKDIMCFEAINTHEPTIQGQVFKYLWEPVWFATEEASRYRIGYCVDFTLDGGSKKVHKMILEPKDTLEYKDYMEFYLYDDYHQTPGVWYSHVEQQAYNENTLLTSIKFTAGKKVEAIDGEVTLTAFIYDPAAGQFDASGNYTGSSFWTIKVVNTAK